jgi:pimeloyl-ACP methyl ester carboxylesterase/predicted glycosyltransferase
MRAKLPHTTGFAERSGVRIHYEVYGEGRETLLFIPPWAIVHSRIYKAQLPWFSDRYRCIAYDPRGNGRSDRPRDTAAYSLDESVGDVLSVMDATSTERAVMIGMSSGGMLASVLGAHHPDRVAGAVLIGTQASIGPGNPAYAPANFQAERERFEGWEKYNKRYWMQDYPDFASFFLGNVFSEKHSTKQLEDGVGWACETDAEVLVRTVEARGLAPSYDVGEAMYAKIKCPLLIIHGDDDRIVPLGRAQAVAKATGAELVVLKGAGHAPQARFPAKVNTLIDDFLQQRVQFTSPSKPAASSAPRGAKRALYLSSPIGLGHGRRDLAIARELRALVPDLQIDWLAQDPVTRLLAAHGERIHPMSARLANESKHIEEQSSDEHDLHAFQAIRRMDEILVANFMRFQEAVNQTRYDLVIADEAWDVDHYWHEHPELKRSTLAWFTDFVGFVPMPSGGEQEAMLTADYNAEMIGHIERHPGLRDRAIFVGNPDDILPERFGPDLPAMREWIPRHFDFSGYILGEHPRSFGGREVLRSKLGYRPGEKVCIVTVGGSAVGVPLLRRILQSMPGVQRSIPGLRVLVVAGPRIEPATLAQSPGVEVRAFVPDLDRHLAACDVAVVQGGLTTCMELAAAGTPFLYFPLRNHFEQNFHVAHRLQRYGAGRRMDYASATPDRIAGELVALLREPARFREVEADGATKAARMLAALL